MRVISSREFRDNQKKYFDLVDQNEQIIVQRGKNKSYVLTPIYQTDKFFNQSHIIEKLNQSIQELKEGKTVKMGQNESLDEFLNRFRNV